MADDKWLFFRRWLAHPLRVASLHPSSERLSALIAAQAVRSQDEVVLEVGAGTGPVSRAMIEAGLPPEQLVMIELDPAMCELLRSEFPDATVLEGDALQPETVVPESWRGRFTNCVSGLPILGCKRDQQFNFVRQTFALMGGEGRLIQYTNVPVPPIQHRPLGLSARRLGFTWSGVFPFYIWEFTSPAAGEPNAGPEAGTAELRQQAR